MNDKMKGKKKSKNKKIEEISTVRKVDVNIHFDW